MASEVLKDEKGLDEYPCSVCGDYKDYANDRFIFCDGCGAGFHQSCCGLQDETFNDAVNEKFFCHYCVSVPKNVSAPKTCSVCKMKRQSLAVMPVVGDATKWVHVVCAYALDCCTTSDTNKVVIDASVIAADPKNEKCRICDQARGSMIECMHPDCATKVHPSCARIELNKCTVCTQSFYFNDVEGGPLWRNPKYFCPEHNILKNGKRIKNPKTRDQRARRVVQLYEWKDHQKKAVNARKTTKRRESSKQKRIRSPSAKVSSKESKRRRVGSACMEDKIKGIELINVPPLTMDDKRMLHTSPVELLTELFQGVAR